MKKLLLLAVASLVVGSASAQFKLHQRYTGKRLSASTQAAKKAEVKTFKASDVVPFNAFVAHDNTYDSRKKAFTAKMKNLTIANNLSSVSSSRRAGTIQSSYTGRGTNYMTSASEQWVMKYGTAEDGTQLLADVIRLPEEWASLETIPVVFSLNSNTIHIEPQKVASGETEDGTKYYYYIHSWESEDGAIDITLNDDGSLTTIEKEDIAYSAFSEDRYDLSQSAGIYVGLVLDISNVKYYMEGQKIVPMAGYEPASLILYPGINVEFDHSPSELVPAYTDINLLNRTDNNCDSYAWETYPVKYNSSTEAFEKDGESITGSSADFSFFADPQISPLCAPILVSSLEGEPSEPFAWSSMPWFVSGAASDWQEESDPPYTFTKGSPNGQLSAVADPTKYKSTIHYQGKPAKPLYFTGISLMLYNYKRSILQLTKTPKLTCKIHKASLSEDGHFVLGDLIAQADLNTDEINTGSQATRLAWTQFYVEDELGMTEDLEYLMLDEEFAVVFEGWNECNFNGTLLGMMSPNPVGNSTTFLVKTDEDSYSGYYLTFIGDALVGFIDACYGYLYTESATNLTIPAEGGSVTINDIQPMLVYQTEAGELTPGLWLDYGSDEVPDWLTINIDPHFTLQDNSLTEAYFHLIFQADALPSGTSGRQANLIFCQEGARLAVTVTQGEGSGINVAVNKLDGKSVAYNLAGQRVNNDYKGLVIKNGRKFVNK